MLYISTIENVTAENLGGFFVGWPNPPSPQMHFELLKNSNKIVLAIDEEANKVVGFITAITDKTLSAYIPFLEVLPDYQDRGIGKELVRRMLERLGNLYAIDLLCDPELQPFYESLGMRQAHGMMVRNYENQAGKAQNK